jgi:hypothetical protein
VTVVRFTFPDGDDRELVETDMTLAIFAAECVYGKPRLRLEVSYLVAPDGASCVLRVGGESAEAAARIFTGLTSVRRGETNFRVQRIDEGPTQEKAGRSR